VTVDSGTLAAKVMCASMLAATGRVDHAFPVVAPLMDSSGDGWRFLVGCISVIRPSVTGACGHPGHVATLGFQAQGEEVSPGAVALAQIANPWLQGDRSTAAARWRVAFNSGIGPAVLGAAVDAAGACLRARYPYLRAHYRH
jgi:hypothetical protein